MAAERILTPKLAAFLLLVLGVMLAAADRRWSRPDAGTAITLLRDGDLEGAERRRLWRTLLDRGLVSSDRRVRLCGATAALLLEEPAHYTACLQPLALTAGMPILPGDAAMLDDLCLGEPAMRTLLQAMLAESNGQLELAASGYQRAEAQADMWHLSTLQGIAAAGRARQHR